MSTLPTPTPEPPSRGRLVRGYAWFLATPLGLLAIVAWIALAALAVYYLPPPVSGSGSLADFTPRASAAAAAEARGVALFGQPLSRVLVVQRDPNGLSQATLQRTVAAALAVDQGTSTQQVIKPVGAVPLVNTQPIWTYSREQGTTAVTYLFFEPSVNWADQLKSAEVYGNSLGGASASVVGVTGSVPARLAQENAIAARLNLLELVSLVVVAVVVALALRSLFAPVVMLLSAAVSYLIVVRLIQWVGERTGLLPPGEIEPVLVVLLLGITADYAIFYLAAMRTRLARGERRRTAARDTTMELTPLIVTAGLMVAAGTGALLFATQATFRSFAPGLAITVLVGLAVAVSLIPASMALLGRVLFWPRAPRPQTGTGAMDASAAIRRFSRFPTSRPFLFLIVVACVAVLVVAAAGLHWAQLGFDFINGLPPGANARVAGEAASTGFAPGIVAPTEIIVEKAGIGAQTQQLATLQSAIARQPGVAGVLGPHDQKSVQGLQVAVSSNGAAARYVVVFSGDPLGGSGVTQLKHVQQAMPRLLAGAGLSGARVSYAGDTALTQDTTTKTVSDLGRVGIAVIIIDVVLLMVFLRSLAAPLYLVAASVLALAAALGLTVAFFRWVAGVPDLTFYVPFAASVLLISLGSDYTIYVVGRIWEERRARPLGEAIRTAMPEARHAVSMAAIALALSFATLAIVNVLPFQELAFLLTAGVLLDAFFVRSLLVPALVGLFGRTWTPSALERANRRRRRRGSGQ